MHDVAAGSTPSPSLPKEVSIVGYIALLAIRSIFDV
jgi:hypothetical protein